MEVAYSYVVCKHDGYISGFILWIAFVSVVNNIDSLLTLHLLGYQKEFGY